MNYLFIGDTPTGNTGLGNVARNIVNRLSFKEQIHFWGVGYKNEPHNFPFKIYSANMKGEWSDSENLKKLTDLLFSFRGEVTMFTNQDCWRFKHFCSSVDTYRSKHNLKIISYIPIDSPLTEDDIDFIKRIDVPVAYTLYGARELQKYTNKDIKIIPHGIETENFWDMGYKPIKKYFPFLQQNRILLANVNTNSLRKANDVSIQILKELHMFNSCYHLYMHCRPIGEYNLLEVAKQCGVEKSVSFFPDVFKNKKTCSVAELREIYNCADIVLTTSLGEGWGFSAFEAALCGRNIALPMHTSFKEMFDETTCIPLQTSGEVYVRDKRWPRLDIEASARSIHESIFKGSEEHNNKRLKAKDFVSKFNWQITMKDWEALLK